MRENCTGEVDAAAAFTAEGAEEKEEEEEEEEEEEGAEEGECDRSPHASNKE